MYKIISDYYIENMNVVKASEFKLELPDVKVIYEVVRVINNKVLFLDDHMKRLKKSIIDTGQDLTLLNDIELSIEKLVTDFDFNKNIKIDVFNNNFRCYFMESFYPDKVLYENGIETVTHSFEREAPTVKKLDMNYKRTIESIKGDRYFEVLLEDQDGYVIEGSRSNLVFVKGNTLISAPLDRILSGVTFMNILKLAAKEEIEVEFRLVHKDEFEDIDACFITGTSIGILPIRRINDHEYQADQKIIRTLMNLYNDEAY